MHPIFTGEIDMNYVTFLKKGIIRISAKEDMPQSYLEKYGILTIPKASDETSNITINDNSITLPDGKTIEFFTREDTEIWDDEINYMHEKFKNAIPISRIQGRPDEVFPPKCSELEGHNSEKKFGISFKISQDEKFYGLGEASSDRIQLRGNSYQNWAVYKQNEISIPLVYSNKNWGIFIATEDRHFVDIDDNIKDSLTILGNLDELDVFLLYGDSMKDIIRLYTDLTGKSMILPKWGYGLTYIAQIHQNQFEILDDMMRFRKSHIPCDNVSLEPGWMTKFYDYSFDKKWDLKKFHIEEWMHSRDCKYSFLSVMRRFGFHVALWMCMDYDLCDHEEGLAGGESKLVSWYEHVKKFVDDGVDGFKIDPADMLMRINPNTIYTNGESELKMHNISQVLAMKQMHQGFSEQMNIRPFIHYCGGYTGQQRWGAATTGDNDGLLGSMIWLENLALSGFMNSTVDMDVYSPEAIHFAMLAPWAHHNAWMGCSQPWYAGEDNERVYIYYARLRYNFLPYIYSLAIEGHEDSVPIIRPMMLEFQNDEKCLELSRQYMIGQWILISAFTDTVYLPDGMWVDFWTGTEYNGQTTLEHYTPPKDRGGAFFIKKGAIIPRWKDRDYTTQYTDEEVELHFYPHEKSEYIFREDDGISLDYLQNNSCHTKITCDATGNTIKIHIGDRAGDYNGKPSKRIWKIFIHNTDKKAEIECSEQVEICEI